MDAYRLSFEEVFSSLRTSEKGLSSFEAEKRLAQFGPNSLPSKSGTSALKVFFRQFSSFLVLILIGAIIISFAIGEFVDGFVILSILILNAVLGFIQEYRAEKSLSALRKLSSPSAIVVRDGISKKVPASLVVPGDVILLREGDHVPADARIFASFSLAAAESSLTGESAPVSKVVTRFQSELSLADQKNMVFSGTPIVRGRGSGVVTSTGISSEIGKIAKLLTTIDDEPSPLQKRLGILGRWIGVLTIAVAILVFFLEYFGGTPFDEVLLGSIALAVAAIPEGLPAVVTISLALGVRRMVRRHALIRRLPAVQTLGGTTVICSDKTGTLTMDQMTVTSVFVDGKVILVSGEGYSLKGKFSDSTKDLSFLLRIGALCNDAQIGEKGVFGDPTEGALLVSAKKGGLDLKDLSFSYPRVDEIPFSSERKMMSTFHKAGSHYELYVKGAPDVLLAKCTHILFNGRVVSLNSSYREEILLANESFAKEALRVLGFAYTPSRNTSFAEERLIFVGLQGMIDPPRPEVKKAIQVCSDAGIRVVMITGDHPLTAVAIARQLGISGSVLLGVELDSIGDLSKIVGEVGVYARVNPVHKQKIVHALKQMGHIVAMTGDGVNDAPSLKDADIGIAMGITGTDVARESADMVLTDDNFASIVDAVEEGRGIYDNIKKFVNYLLSSNLGEVFVLLFAALLSFPLPLVATQILWINLVTDGLPATALSVDPPARGIMRRSPRLPKSNILSRNMGLNIFSIGFLVAVGVLFLFSVYSSDISHARTVAFTSLVVFEMVRLHMVRRQYGVGMFSNFWLLGSILLTIILQFIVVYTPFGRFFEAVALSFLDWVLIFAVALALFVFGTLSNTIIRRLTKETD